MKKTIIVLLSLGLMTACAKQEPLVAYPQTVAGDHVDEYFGTSVADPFRWIEEIESQPVKDWVAEQNALSLPALKELPHWEPLNQRLTELWNYERYTPPYKRAGKIFYGYNNGEWDHSIFYGATDLGDEGEILLDPHKLSEDGTISARRIGVSPKGRYLSYGTSDGGTDWTDYHVRDLSTGEDLDDLLKGIKFSSVAWTPDESGFYYSRYPQREDGTYDDRKQAQVFFHKLGDPQASDRLIYKVTDHPTREPYATLTDDGRYLILNLNGGKENGVYYRDLQGSEEVVRLLDQWDGRYDFLGAKEEEFLFRTTVDAPYGRVIAVNLNKPEKTNWRDVIPESDRNLTSVSYIGGKLVMHYLSDATSQIELADLDGSNRRKIQMPGLGSVYGLWGDVKDPETFFVFHNFTTPDDVYHLNVETAEVTLFKSANYAADFSELEVSQHFYQSKDGTKIPMFLVHKKGLERNGKNPTQLYGYGGFNASITPFFHTGFAGWLDMGGVLAVPNLRGGGEYGAEWHQAGIKLQKQNTFDDFIAAAEWLIEQKITSPQHLAITGFSNGGLLVGAVMTQRPELFAAAVPGVGVLDMLRYHTTSANARNWSHDYGLSENEEEFEALYAYSPVHNTKAGTCYPATLIFTGERDDRVLPWHSYKFTAVMQRDQGCDHPIRLTVETRAGHGAGKPIWMQVEEFANQLAFLAQHTGIK